MSFRTLALPITAMVVLSAAAYSYFQRPQKPENEEWVVIGTTPKEESNRRDKVLEITDRIFISNDQQRMYSKEELNGSEALIRRKLTGQPDVYLRRTNLLSSIFDSSDNYFSEMAEAVVEKYLGKGGRTPREHLSTRLAAHDKTALQVAALFLQLKEHFSSFVNRPENCEEFAALEGEVTINVIEKGRVQFFERVGDDIVFSIQGDEVSLTGASGTIGGYTSSRIVTIGSPADEKVACAIKSTFQRVE